MPKETLQKRRKVPNPTCVCSVVNLDSVNQAVKVNLLLILKVIQKQTICLTVGTIGFLKLFIIIVVLS